MQRAYFRESLIWIVGFIVTLELAMGLADVLPEGSPWRLLAIAPVTLALVAGLWVEVRMVARSDELQRTIYLMATLVGSMCAVLFCAVATLGEELHLWARVAPIWGIGATGAGFLLGWIGARRHYA